MKRIICIVMSLTISTILSGQIIKATYKEKLETQLPEVEDPGLASLIAEKFKDLEAFYELLAEKNKSIYSPISEKVGTNSIGKEIVVYKDILSKDYKSEALIYEKRFLIVDVLPEYKWRFENCEKQINGITCKKAMLADSTIAWYAPSIPLSSGPRGYYGLPGLILEIKTKTTLISCENIETKSDGEIPILPPKKGKKISREEFNTIITQKKKELGVEGASGGVKIITM